MRVSTLEGIIGILKQFPDTSKGMHKYMYSDSTQM